MNYEQLRFYQIGIKIAIDINKILERLNSNSKLYNELKDNIKGAILSIRSLKETKTLYSRRIILKETLIYLRKLEINFIMLHKNKIITSEEFRTIGNKLDKMIGSVIIYTKRIEDKLNLN